MLAAAAFNLKRTMRLLLRLVESVFTWRCGRQEQNTQHKFMPQVLNEECHVVFLRVDLTLFVNFISQKQVVVIVVY